MSAKINQGFFYGNRHEMKLSTMIRAPHAAIMSCCTELFTSIHQALAFKFAILAKIQENVEIKHLLTLLANDHSRNTHNIKLVIKLLVTFFFT